MEQRKNEGMEQRRRQEWSREGCMNGAEREVGTEQRRRQGWSREGGR